MYLHATMYRVGVLVLILLTVITKIIADETDFDPQAVHYDPALEDTRGYRYEPTASDEEYFRHIHSMINAYRSDMLGGRLVIETNALIDTKYKMWKRNADLINSLLSLPKGMNDAGR